MAAKKTTTKTTVSPAAKTEPAVAKKAVKTAKKAAKKAVKPSESKQESAAPVKKTAKKAVSVKKTAKPTLEELTRAAYLNYRRRVELGLPGDSHGDWLEAERTLGKS